MEVGIQLAKERLELHLQLGVSLPHAVLQANHNALVHKVHSARHPNPPNLLKRGEGAAAQVMGSRSVRKCKTLGVIRATLKESVEEGNDGLEVVNRDPGCQMALENGQRVAQAPLAGEGFQRNHDLAKACTWWTGHGGQGGQGARVRHCLPRFVSAAGYAEIAMRRACALPSWA